MALRIEVADVEGAVRVWVNAYPGLTGLGNPLANGVHIGEARSPARGAIASLEVIAPRSLTDIADTARVTFRVDAVGSETGARQVAEGAARALAKAIMTLQVREATVTTKRGDLVRLIVGGDIAGPTYAGQLGGKSTYRVDATFACQDVT